MSDKKCQYEIILDVILEACYSMPISFSEILARKISNALIDQTEQLKSENTSVMMKVLENRKREIR